MFPLKDHWQSQVTVIILAHYLLPCYIDPPLSFLGDLFSTQLLGQLIVACQRHCGVWKGRGRYLHTQFMAINILITHPFELMPLMLSEGMFHVEIARLLKQQKIDGQRMDQQRLPKLVHSQLGFSTNQLMHCSSYDDRHGLTRRMS